MALPAHTDRIFCAEFASEVVTRAPDDDSSSPSEGYSLATASADGTIAIWHLPPPSPEIEGEEEEEEEDSTPPRVPTVFRSLEGHTDEVLRVAWHPKPASSGLIASGGAEGAVILWDHQTGDVRRTIKVGEEQIYSLSFAHEGEAMFCGIDNVVKSYDTETGKATAEREFQRADETNAPTLGGPRNPEDKPFVFDLAQSQHDDRIIAVALSDGSVRVVDTRMPWTSAAGQVAALTGHDKHVTGCTFTNASVQGAGCVAAVSGDGRMLAWDLRTSKIVVDFEAHENPAYGVTTVGNDLYSWSVDGCVRVWDTTSWGSAADAKEEGEGVSTNDVEVSGTAGSKTDETSIVLRNELFPGLPVFAFAISKDGKLAAACGEEILTEEEERRQAEEAEEEERQQQAHHGHSHGADGVCGGNHQDGEDEETDSPTDADIAAAVAIAESITAGELNESEEQQQDQHTSGHGHSHGPGGNCDGHGHSHGETSEVVDPSLPKYWQAMILM